MKHKKKFVVIGLGSFGKSIARTLLKNNADVIVMDNEIKNINQMKQEGFELAVQADSTELAILAKFVNADDIAIISMGESFEANILTISNLKEIGVKYIYTRSLSDKHTNILGKMEVTEILFPEIQEGHKFALRLLYKDVMFIDEYAPGLYIGEIKVPERFVGQSILDLNLRNSYNVNVIALKQFIEKTDGTIAEKLIPHGFETILLSSNHSLIVVGKEQDIKKIINK